MVSFRLTMLVLRVGSYCVFTTRCPPTHQHDCLYCLTCLSLGLWFRVRQTYLGARQEVIIFAIMFNNVCL